MIDIIDKLPITAWHGPFDPALQHHAIGSLESGRVPLMNLPFPVADEERFLLSPNVMGDARKNISLDPAGARTSNTSLTGADATKLAGMMERFASNATRLVGDLLPGYAATLQRARTSFRPAEIAGRHYSPRHDDRRLHVDAFPSRPMRGRRILRLFSNIAPDGAPREWRVGEPFEAYARRFAPKTPAIPGSAWLLQRIGVTKGRRSEYDRIMLRLHDAGKLDTNYQTVAPQADVSFASGTTWLCFTDQVLHAALAGHCALEQTFHIPLEAMAQPELSPLRVLERLRGHALI